MIVFCDTTVLVAACVRRHPHYPRARPLLESIVAGEHKGIISMHSIAEAYAALTSLPVTPRISPADAEAIVEANIRAHFRLQAVSRSMYERAVRACVKSGLSGGKVYDALLLECARRCSCERIYTFNIKDFLKLAPDLHPRIVAP